jgi:hypothetical protein
MNVGSCHLAQVPPADLNVPILAQLPPAQFSDALEPGWLEIVRRSAWRVGRSGSRRWNTRRGTRMTLRTSSENLIFCELRKSTSEGLK